MTRRAVDRLTPAESRAPRVAWVAVPPAGSGLEESLWPTMQEARAAARGGGGYGWEVQGRRIEIVSEETNGL